MGVENYRSAIASAYPGERWKRRVLEMPDNQVIAIYNHFVRDGVFNRIRVPKKASDPNYHQISLWELGLERRTS